MWKEMKKPNRELVYDERRSELKSPYISFTKSPEHQFFGSSTDKENKEHKEYHGSHQGNLYKTLFNLCPFDNS